MEPARSGMEVFDFSSGGLFSVVRFFPVRVITLKGGAVCVCVCVRLRHGRCRWKTVL